MSFGFDKVKKPDPPERNLDLSGLRMKPPVPPVEKEKKALAKGEKLGLFKPRTQKCCNRAGENRAAPAAHSQPQHLH
jgi:hypothetical protein